jgi:SAM-dependent methyltransferase
MVCVTMTEGSQSRTATPDLSGDRDLEWTYVAVRLGRYISEDCRVLDFGCGNGVLAVGAAGLGARVLAIDLMPRDMPCLDPRLEFRQTDLMMLDEGKMRFDLVLNCSTIEHVGLSGRYDTVEAPDGDLEAMAKLCRLMNPDGHMLLTIPVGHDAVVRPLHRVYGTKRLPRLLEGYEVVESSFWRKDARNVWIPCTRDEAIAEQGHERYYALGAMVLRPAPPLARYGADSQPMD